MKTLTMPDSDIAIYPMDMQDCFIAVAHTELGTALIESGEVVDGFLTDNVDIRTGEKRRGTPLTSLDLDGLTEIATEADITPLITLYDASEHVLRPDWPEERANQREELSGDIDWPGYWACGECGSSAVEKKAYMTWDVHRQRWVPDFSNYPLAHCNQCAADVGVEWKEFGRP